MIKNVFSREDLLGFSRQQSRDKVAKTVKKKDLEEATNDGWEIQKRNKKTVRVTKPKKKSKLLESRVWTVLYRMGFAYMSGEGGALLDVSASDEESPKDQVDVVAVDEEVGLCVECKSRETPKKDPRFSEKLAKHAGKRKAFANAIRRHFPSDKKRHVGSVMFTWDFVLTENDEKRARESKVTLFDEYDLQYFEAIVKHLGPAARYQFLAEVLPGKTISGLSVRVPALRTKMGDFVCYTFSIRPEYLLKIGYVARRAKGKAIDVDAYQRMIKKSRLRDISQYISDDGIFPTNIVINIERRKHLQFDRGKQEADKSGALFGWLTLSPSYGAAWIIDGQHRLFAYSGHTRANTSYLNVLAFEGLKPSKQAQLFVDINSEQKRVKRSLLVELAADLKWDDPDEEERIAAVISKAGMALDEDLDSPLRGRVLLSDAKRTNTRCVSLTSLFTALNKPRFFIVGKRKGVTEYGPLWREDASDALCRTIKVVKSWLSVIADAAKEWWFMGAAEGGGLAMNNGVTVCINVLRSVLEHLRESSNLLMLDDRELVELLAPYAEALGKQFARKSADERLAFRQLQGADGQATGTRWCQEELNKAFPAFVPPGLEDWIQRQKANTNDQARRIIDWIELTLQENILSSLKEKYNETSTHWWFAGVPKNVRKKVDDRINESDGKAGTREQNFDLIHYREIIKQNWDVFGGVFAYGTGNKDKRTVWIAEVGTMRNTVKHPSRREFLSFDKLAQLQGYQDWLKTQFSRIAT